MSRVLVVEDEQHLADGLRFNLEAEGYQVQVTDTGESALQVLKSDPVAFDVVVLDVMLPGKDGFSVMSEMRGSGQFVPTLMLTARGHPNRTCSHSATSPSTSTAWSCMSVTRPFP